MSLPMIALGILLFALATALLYAWGLVKSVRQQDDLQRLLLSKAAQKVLRALKKRETLSQKEIAALCTGLRAGEFWSRKQVQVENPEEFGGQLAAFMVEQQLLEKTPKGRYRRKK